MNETTARAGGLHFTCFVCHARIRVGLAKSSGWRGQRVDKDALRPVGGGNGQRWWCPDHLPDDLPPAPSRGSAAPHPELGARRRVLAYASDDINRSSRLVFAFSIDDIARAAGLQEWMARAAIRKRQVDPRSLADIIRWAVARPGSGPAVGYDMFITRTPHGLPSREEVLQRFHALGFTAPAAHDLRAIDILGDRVTIASAVRLLRHMEKSNLSTIRRSKAREIMVGRDREAVRKDPEAAELADKLRAELGVGRASGPEAVAVGGLILDLETGKKLLDALRRASPRRRDQITGALTLLRNLTRGPKAGRAPAGPKKSPRKAIERKRKRLAKTLVRSVTAAG